MTPAVDVSTAGSTRCVISIPLKFHISTEVPWLCADASPPSTLLAAVIARPDAALSDRRQPQYKSSVCIEERNPLEPCVMAQNKATPVAWCAPQSPLEEAFIEWDWNGVHHANCAVIFGVSDEFGVLSNMCNPRLLSHSVP